MNKKKILFLTGAAGDIGQGIAKYFNAHDWDVIGLDKNMPRNKKNFLHFEKVDLLTFVSDSSYQKDVLAHFNSLCKKLSTIDCLINNAAIQVAKPSFKLTGEDFETSFRVNSIAPFLLCSYFYKQLLANKGNIINISSIHSKLTLQDFSAYAASKSALDSITRSLAIEYGGKVKVNAIAPGAIATKMLKAGLNKNVSLKKMIGLNPSSSIGSVDDVASLAYAICINKSPFFSGSVIDLNGGIGNLLHH
jgi:NAD(P)-dependent dehydrogenase (short-subunit alcohol dehydrogenase family)